MDNDIELRCLRRDNALVYKIQWLGNIVKLNTPNGVARFIRVVCKPWSEDIELASKSFKDDEKITVNVPLAFIKYIRVGDLWKAGRCIGQVPLIEESFKSVLIDKNTVTTVTAGAREKEGGVVGRYLLPYEAFDGHRDHIHSCLARVVVNDSLALLIPCLEILRFYFGASGALVNKLFEGYVPGPRLCRSVSTDETGERCEIHMVEGLNGVAATDVARIAFDPEAQRSIQALINSGIRASVNQEPFYPRALPPFAGLTDLRVRGQWIAGDSFQTFLVHQIQTCTHPFPFEELAYHVWSSPKSCLDSGNEDRKNDLTQRINQDRDTGAKVKAPTLKQLRAHAFPDLAKKKIRAVWHRQSFKSHYQNCGPEIDTKRGLPRDCESSGFRYSDCTRS